MRRTCVQCDARQMLPQLVDFFAAVQNELERKRERHQVPMVLEAAVQDEKWACISGSEHTISTPKLTILLRENE